MRCFAARIARGFIEHERGGIYNSAIAQAWFDRWLVEEDDPSCLLIAPTEE